MMAVRVGQPAIRVFTLTVTLGNLLKDGSSLTFDARSQPIMRYAPSRSNAYMGLHPDGNLLGNLLKDGGSPKLDARSQPIMRYTLMAARAGQLSIRVFTLTVTFRGVS